MKNQSEQLKPTLETDALILSKGGFGITNYEWREHSRKLERERDEWYYKAHANAAFVLEARAERDEARVERDALRDAVNALHDYVHGKRNDDKDISEILNGAMKI